jgi:hypothetical protein
MVLFNLQLIIFILVAETHKYIQCLLRAEYMDTKSTRYKYVAASLMAVTFEPY